MPRRVVFVAALSWALLGCGDDDTAATGSGGAGGLGEGGGGEAGATGCPAGSLEVAPETCQPAGVPQDQCGVGFEPVGDGSCRPILPDELCPAWRMAVPGEGACREIAPCGEGPWGDIPEEASTQYVDGSYQNIDSDGSKAKPWPFIFSGIENATDGAIVAIAAGTYDEDLVVFEKRLRLWGRCPELTRITGSNAPLFGTLFIEADADGSEIRDLSIESVGIGVVVSGSTDVLLDRVVIRDTEEFGLVVSDQLGPSSAHLERSVIDAATGAAIITEGADVTISGSAIRSTRPRADQTAGVGLNVQPGSVGALPSNALLLGSVVEHNRAVGAFALGSNLTVTDSVVRHTLPMLADLSSGDGIIATDDPLTAAPASLHVSGSYVAHNLESGILVNGADTVIENTTVLDTQATESEGIAGAGIALQLLLNLPTATNVSVSNSFVEDSTSFGVIVAGVDAVLSGVVVRATKGRPLDDGFGDGILVTSSGQPATATIVGVVVSDSQRAGIATFGARVDVSGALLECNAVSINAEDFAGATVSLRDGGQNACSCDGREQSCSAQSANLAPPDAI